MKLLLFSGNHPRHLYVHQKILESLPVAGAVCMERESVMPTPPLEIPERDRKNFDLHFNERLSVESRFYGNVTPGDTFKSVDPLFVGPKTLNSTTVVEYVKKIGPDVVFIFGCDLILGDVLRALPKESVNLHLGLSPWYKGSATLFWPFYNMEPQFAGSTFHYIVEEADAGEVIHQSVPDLDKKDGIHDVAAKAVLKAAEEAVKLLKIRRETGSFGQSVAQKTIGRLYLTNQFRPEHLRAIYDLFDNKLVEQYLSGNLTKRKPKLIQHPALK